MTTYTSWFAFLTAAMLTPGACFAGGMTHSKADAAERNARVSLDANVGFGGYYCHHGGILSSAGESLLSSNPVYSGALAITWRAGRSEARVGIRAAGYYGALSGEGTSSSFSLWGGGGDSTTDVTATLVGGYIGAVAEHRGVWASAGAGAFHLQSASERHTYFAPDLAVAFGYNLYLTDFMALKISLEGGGWPFWAMHIRGAINAGVLVRI